MHVTFSNFEPLLLKFKYFITALISQILKDEARNVFTILLIYRSEDLILHSITQTRSKDEVLGSNHYKMLLYSDSPRLEVCTGIPTLGCGNLRGKFKRRILIY